MLKQACAQLDWVFSMTGGDCMTGGVSHDIDDRGGGLSVICTAGIASRSCCDSEFRRHCVPD